MKIIQVHCFYKMYGGEDQVIENEKRILTNHLHNIDILSQNNTIITQRNLLYYAVNSLWNQKAYLSILKNGCSYDVIHIHNTFPIISPSIIHAANRKNIPVVQTLHNFRLLCPNALLMRNNNVCEDCIGKVVPWPGILHCCYRNSFSASVITATMLSLHRIIGTYQNYVDIFIALTEFEKRKFIQGGLPAEKIVVKPNFISTDPGVRNEVGEYVLFVGRLSTEKGVHTLLQTWCKLPRIPLKIIGDGPLLNEICAYIQQNKLNQVELIGRCDHETVLLLMKSARYLVAPSECYETFGMVVTEAYACGLPVIASRLGAMQELVLDGETGLHFTPGDANDLAEKVAHAWNNVQQTVEMGRRARQEYEKKYTSERNYEMLMAIYQQAIENHKKQ